MLAYISHVIHDKCLSARPWYWHCKPEKKTVNNELTLQNNNIYLREEIRPHRRNDAQQGRLGQVETNRKRKRRRVEKQRKKRWRGYTNLTKNTQVKFLLPLNGLINCRHHRRTAETSPTTATEQERNKKKRNLRNQNKKKNTTCKIFLTLTKNKALPTHFYGVHVDNRVKKPKPSRLWALCFTTPCPLRSGR